MINERGYWMSHEETDTHYCDPILKEALVKMFNVKTVVDIGCGNGEYTKHFIDHGINCIGYDGSPLTPKITNGLCKVMDFSEPVDIGKFDLVLSIEVGEHIPQAYEQIFIDNLCRAAKNTICLSWAIEGQRGTGHVNCHNNDYVIREMRKRDFELDVERTREIRKHGSLPWIKNTIMIYVKNI